MDSFPAAKRRAADDASRNRDKSPARATAKPGYRARVLRIRSFRRSLALCGVLWAAGSGAAPQGARARPAEREARLLWRLPKGAFVLYRRRGEPPRGAGLEASAVPGFYEYELVKGRRLAMRRPVLLDLVPMLALSLGGRRPEAGRAFKGKRRFAAFIDAGAVTASGGFKTTAAEAPSAVRQSGSFVLRGEGKAPRAEPARRGMRGMPLARAHLVQAKLRIARRVDALAGRVRGFDAFFDGRIVAGGGEKERRLLFEEHWLLDRVVAPDSRDFRRLVRRAIEDGERWLAEARIGGFGRAALALLALEKSEPHREKPAIQRLLARVRAGRPSQTYEYAVGIQALEAYYEPPNETQQLREGLITAPGRRELAAEDRELVADWLALLLANRSRSGGNRWRFHYQVDESFDNSNTQFAVLGLQAAARCGLKIPRAAWEGLARHFLAEALEREREEVALSLTTYRELRQAAAGRAGRTRARGPKYRPRGFTYRKPERTTAARGRRARIVFRPIPYGSMTCAGVTGLNIVQAELERAGAPGRLLGRIRRARMEGFAWLLAHYDVRRNPGREGAWYYYYLYSLERTMELAGIARLGPRHWYFDGAMQLIARQQPDGSWSEGNRPGNAVVNTCFALLFLKRAVAPAVTR